MKVFDDIIGSSRVLAADVAVELGCELEDLQTSHHQFRSGLQSIFSRILTMAQQKKEKVIVFDEAVPGFTLMLFKHEEVDEKYMKDGSGVMPDATMAEAEACSRVAVQYFQRTGNRVLSVMTPDAVFAFFPVEDLRKNLKEMGFYLLE